MRLDEVGEPEELGGESRFPLSNTASSSPRISGWRGDRRDQHMKVVIRADSSVQLGSGHVIRCLTLAGELRSRGASVRFVCREYEGHMIPTIERHGYPVARLSVPPVSLERGEYECDARETLESLREEPVNWLVVDHYELAREWERRMRPATQRILVIDDLANRHHDCEVLLDQGYFGSVTQDRYATLVDKSCVRLLGPQFALLHPDYRTVRRLLPRRDGTVCRVLVFFGGSDLSNDTLRVLEALSCTELKHLAVDVVVGQNHPDKKSIQGWVSQRPGAALHGGLPSLAGLMARADLAVGGGGSTTWERACLALPSVVATLADNQVGFSTSLAADGCHILLGTNTDVSVSRWRAVLVDLLGNSERLVDISRRSALLTDGAGAGRVAEAMLGDGSAVRQVAVAAGGSAASHLHTKRVPELNGGVPILSRDGRALHVTVLSDSMSWLNGYLPVLVEQLRRSGHPVDWVHDPQGIVAGDVCFIIGCSRLLSTAVLGRSKFNLVVHESALPEGRGWSPMTWQVLEDRRNIIVTLFEAADPVDSGRIYLQTAIELTGRELVDEWREHQARATIELCCRWIREFPDVVQGAREQTGMPTFYPRRGPADSKLDPHSSLASQFDVLRTVDNVRYPAFFEYRGGHYKLFIERDDPGRITEPEAKSP